MGFIYEAGPFHMGTAPRSLDQSMIRGSNTDASPQGTSGDARPHVHLFAARSLLIVTDWSLGILCAKGAKPSNLKT
jgi:hypothetical protein